MGNTTYLAKRFREVLLDGTWVANTNYKQQLTGLDFQTATARHGDWNSIAVLAQHIHYYIAGIKKVFEGGALAIRDQFSFDFAPITSQQQWDAFLSTLWADAEDFATRIEQLEQTSLQQPFVDEKYGSYLRNIDGMIEHSYYHLAQIVLLKKILDLA